MSTPTTRYTPILADVIKDKELTDIYNKLKEDKSLGMLFYGGEVDTLKEFVELVRCPNTLFYVVVDMEDGDLVCVVWLNGKTDCNCSLHGAFFKKYFRRSVTIMKGLVKGFFETTPGLESIIGYVPEDNKLARNFAKKVGCTEAGCVPNLIRNKRTGRLSSGVIYYMLKDEV